MNNYRVYGLSHDVLESGKIVKLPEDQRLFFYMGKEVRIKKEQMLDDDYYLKKSTTDGIITLGGQVIPKDQRVFVQRGHSIVIEKGTQGWSIGPGQKDIKPLLCSASPRDIEDVLKHRAKIPYDKFYAKYHKEADAYKILRDYFLTHFGPSGDYTHMCIVPDDLVVKTEHIEWLLHDLQELDYPILAGVCNLDWQHQDLYSPCWKLTMDGFFKEEDLQAEPPIKNPEYEGFACTFIRRDVLEKFALDGFNHTGVSFDLGLAVECYRRNIPIHVDCRVKMMHLKNRLDNGSLENCFIGKKPPSTLFEPATN